MAHQENQALAVKSRRGFFCWGNTGVTPAMPNTDDTSQITIITKATKKITENTQIWVGSVNEIH